MPAIFSCLASWHCNFSPSNNALLTLQYISNIIPCQAPQNIMPEIWCSVHGKLSFVALLMWCQGTLRRHRVVDLWWHAPWQCLLRSRHSHWLRAGRSSCQCSWKRNVPGVCENPIAKSHMVPVVQSVISCEFLNHGKENDAISWILPAQPRRICV